MKLRHKRIVIKRLPPNNNSEIILIGRTSNHDVGEILFRADDSKYQVGQYVLINMLSGVNLEYQNQKDLTILRDNDVIALIQEL